MFLSECRVFPSALCFAGKKKLMTTRFSMLLKSNASLTCFRACCLPGRAKDLSVPRYKPKKSPFVKEQRSCINQPAKPSHWSLVYSCYMQTKCPYINFSKNIFSVTLPSTFFSQASLFFLIFRLKLDIN
jgi:hypothetical protein